MSHAHTTFPTHSQPLHTQERCQSVAAQLLAAEQQLTAATDVQALRRAATQRVFDVAAVLHRLLGGSAGPDPQQHGLTSDEERTVLHCPPVCCVSGWGGEMLEALEFVGVETHVFSVVLYECISCWFIQYTHTCLLCMQYAHTHTHLQFVHLFFGFCVYLPPFVTPPVTPCPSGHTWRVMSPLSMQHSSCLVLLHLSDALMNFK